MAQPQFFVPGEKQGAPAPGFQQGHQPLPGQPGQSNVNQLAHQMGGMNVSNGSFGGPGVPVCDMFVERPTGWS